MCWNVLHMSDAHASWLTQSSRRECKENQEDAERSVAAADGLVPNSKPNGGVQHVQIRHAHLGAALARMHPYSYKYYACEHRQAYTSLPTSFLTTSISKHKRRTCLKLLGRWAYGLSAVPSTIDRCLVVVDRRTSRESAAASPDYEEHLRHIPCSL